MATKATKYQRIVFEPGGVRIVPIGLNGRVTCTTLPDSLEEVREILSKLNGLGEVYGIGRGDDYIMKNPCELKYYLDGKLVRHLK